MPKKKRKETQEEQSARFREEVERMISVGELSPTEAGKILEGIVRRASKPPSK